ncbi:helix-turn-helix domain-containing protein [Kineosporia rhizophila]|uniref:helix-turn-helix domain-containing protein n=1 Tax=Kineosporia rhizophila TaxID=84633 RepID=UPI000A8CC871|nr:helix-turn-helix domain-containing protein [Kineosporia rhizophila]MCE0534589.1 helix-turn-helix domain-containing protein [Kineosporia rhizophila]
MNDLSDERFSLPLYTVAEASRYLGVSNSTFRSWAQSHRRPAETGEQQNVPAAVTRIPVEGRGSASVPFIGLAEGLVLAGIRKSGVPLQRIRPALDQLRTEFGMDHVLASRRLYTDGAEVLYDFGRHSKDPEDASALRQLVVVRHGQRAFTEVVAQYLQQIEFASDDFAQLIRLPRFGSAKVVAAPGRNFGQPTFQRGGARLEDVLGLFWAGESLATVSAEYGVPEDELEDAVRAASRPTAA